MESRIWSEFEIINRFFSTAQNRLPSNVIAGIGDDAAVIAPGETTNTLITHDMMVEDVHFKSSWMSPYNLARKLVKINISDIAAMGGIPVYAILSIALPPTLEAGWLESFSKGLRETLEEFNLSLIGGDTSLSSGPVVVAMTMLGKNENGPPLLRHSPNAYDRIYVTGTIGDASLGLMILNQKMDESRGTKDVTYLINRHLNPSPRIAIGHEIASKHLATAAIDISDGLVADLSHLLEETSLGAEIRLEDIPLSESFRHKAGLYHPSPEKLTLSGGEDYELLFTSPHDLKGKKVLPPETASQITPIGIITEDPNIRILKKGVPFTLDTSGFQHQFLQKG